MSSQNRLNRLIERLLNYSASRQVFARNPRVAVLLVPVAFFTIVALVRVQAASHSSWKINVALLQTADNQPAPPAAPAPSTPTAPAPAVQGAKVMPATGVALEYSGAPASPNSPDTPADPSVAGAPAAAQNDAPAHSPAAESQSAFDRTLSFSGNLSLTASAMKLRRPPIQHSSPRPAPAISATRASAKTPGCKPVPATSMRPDCRAASKRKPAPAIS